MILKCGLISVFIATNPPGLIVSKGVFPDIIDIIFVLILFYVNYFFDSFVLFIVTQTLKSTTSNESCEIKKYESIEW